MTGPLSRGLERHAAVVDAENPWPGLAPFAEEHSAYFYGRGREVEDLFRLVRLNRLAVLYGQSGLGKTSLLQAALYPRLRAAGLLPVPIRLDYSSAAEPARSQIWRAIETALRAQGIAPPPLNEDETLWEFFHRRTLRLSGADNRTMIPVLVFDQFEELFTLGAERTDGREYVRDGLVELAALVENHPPDRVEARFNREPKLVAQYDFDRQDYRILLSLREDYLAHLHELSSRIPSITLNNMRLAPLDGARALEAVEKPGGRLVTRQVAEGIVRFVAGAGEEHRTAEGSGAGGGDHSSARKMPTLTRPIEALVIDPSLLSLFCRELNQKRRAARLPAITASLVADSSENILKEFYDECLADLPEATRRFVEDRLLTPSGFRETIALDSARSELQSLGVPPDALDTLVARRLLHYEQRGRDTRVELTHDVLAPVARQSRTVRREREALAAAEAERRRELEAHERQAQAARAEAEAKYERSRRQRRMVGVFGIAMAAVAAVAVYQWVQAGRQRDSVNLLLVKVEHQNLDLQRQQKALSDTTLVATQARDTAHQMLATALEERARSDSLLADFCSYALKAINRLGDSTRGNVGLSRAYNSLVELSDTSVERMLVRRPAEVCPRQLDTRTESISAGLMLELGDTASARYRGNRALAAARYLERFHDPQSRQVLTQTYASLAFNLFFAKDYPTALAAAREGLPFARAVDPSHDSLAFDGHARIYHYGALDLLRLSRPREARVWADSGLAVVARGRRRGDQNQPALLYTASQLHLRRVEVAIDSTVHDTAAAVEASRAAVSAARDRHQLLNTVNSAEWLANMHYWKADYLRALLRDDEALMAEDSSAAQWGAVLRHGRKNADTTMIVDGLTGIVRAVTGSALIKSHQGQQEAAIVLARAAGDSARALVQVRASMENQVVLSTALHILGHRLEDAKLLLSSDSAFHGAVRIDSLLLERGQGSAPAISGDLEDFLHDISRVLAKRLRADTAGRDSSSRIALLRQAEERQRVPRETLVWLRQRTFRRLNTPAARDSLAVALGNLSWTYLLIERPEQAVEVAKEGIGVSATQTFILPNYFNAVLLSGKDEEAAAIFREYAGRMVEDQPVRFPCAVLRDIRELVGRGVALARHVSVVEGLVAAQHAQCPTPTS